MNKELIKQALIKELNQAEYNILYYKACIAYYWDLCDVKHKNEPTTMFNFDRLNTCKTEKRKLQRKSAKIRETLKCIKNLYTKGL
jgi:hypothetical protein